MLRDSELLCHRKGRHFKMSSHPKMATRSQLSTPLTHLFSTLVLSPNNFFYYFRQVTRLNFDFFNLFYDRSGKNKTKISWFCSKVSEKICWCFQYKWERLDNIFGLIKTSIRSFERKFPPRFTFLWIHSQISPNYLITYSLIVSFF